MGSERTTAAAWLVRGERAILVEVVEARGSVPRGVGTRMLVSAAASAGTIGGGHLELGAIAHARGRLAAAAATAAAADGSAAGATGAATADKVRYALGPSLGQCCGGTVTLRFSPLDAATLAAWPVTAPRFHLQLHGAGHVGRAIMRALAPLDDVAIDWIDEREGEDGFPTVFPGGGEWPAQVRRVLTDAAEAEVEAAPTGAYFLILTHRHDLDLRIVEAVLRRGDFGFLGLIGSRTKKQRFVHYLERRGGVAPEALARLVCPIGIEGITGKEPAVIAAAVAAQLLRVASMAASTSASSASAPASVAPASVASAPASAAR